jgi:hypothetical protein
MLCISPPISVKEPFAVSPLNTEPEALSVIPVEKAPELRVKLQEVLENPDFSIQIPRECLSANLLTQKLKATLPEQRLQRLEDLMTKFRLQHVVVVDPERETAILTRVTAPVHPV